MVSEAFFAVVVAVVVFGNALVVSSEIENNKVKIWPMPASVSYGHTHLYLSNDFGLSTNYESGILKDAFDRMLAVIKLDHIIDANFSALHHSPLLQGLQIVISSPNDQLHYGIDESYKLMVPSPEKPAYAHLEAQTVYGALHGLQTFSQLCHFNFTSRVLEVHMSPWTIIDQPRFSYRGLLIDTARHYLPLPVIKKVIDSMSYAKLNVLHWHIVDTQSFPLEIPSYPKLWDGAYSLSERYTVADAAEVVSYAQKRGINVLAEIDVPGHALSWGTVYPSLWPSKDCQQPLDISNYLCGETVYPSLWPSKDCQQPLDISNYLCGLHDPNYHKRGTGYPSLWPSKDCQQPLDVSNEFTFKVIDGILSDFSKIFKFKFVHLGGDEVNTSCWSTTPHISKWLKRHGMNESQAYQYFVLRAQNVALSHGYEIVNWEETFNDFGNKLSRKTVVHNWLGGGVAQQVVASGLRCIVSNQDKWYLDHLDTTWQEFYANEPLKNIMNLKQQKLVIGGEVCMWGETIDGSDIEQTIWPRAAAAAERLWTPYDKLAKNPREVTRRLAYFRCLLIQRGVAAAPLAGLGRTAPEGPGSCYEQ